MPETDDILNVSVPVPKDRVRDLLSYAATLHSGAADGSPVTAGDPAAQTEARTNDGQGVTLDALRAAGPGLTETAVRRNYQGGESEYWRPFLKLLAQQPEQWVPWESLYGALGLTDRQCAGMLGAAERRCKGYPPYIKAYDGGYFFWMPKDVADAVIELAAS